MQAASSARPERLRCPERFQRRLIEVGGLNRYRQPNYRLAWAQTEIARQGGEWEAEGETYRGHKDVLVGDGLPHWMLLQWCDAGKSIDVPHLPPQGPISWQEENRCPKTGLQILGEYPYHGSYQIALNLVAKVFAKGQLFIEAFPLSSEIVEMMVPIIKASMELSIEAKQRWLREQKEKEEDDRARTFEDAWKSCERNATLASTAWLEDKQRQIERMANAAFLARLQRNRRFQAQGRI
jgi:hypothetical protein